MSADSRMMTTMQVGAWAAKELRVYWINPDLNPDEHPSLTDRMKFIARAVYAHKIARSLMKQGGYVNDN